ncbi:hypothetical protein WMY93_012940 [Mugilogobius chulae]|uniref:C-type lectin domain-containing protein n=1 Tax=Mugilogobius chulae TaxID=88201 RepID=A0AAW0PA86_9GOBI
MADTALLRYVFYECGPQYHFISSPAKTWNEAQQYCRDHYTDLATVESQDDLNRTGLPLTPTLGSWIDAVCSQTEYCLCYKDEMSQRQFFLVNDMKRTWADCQIKCRLEGDDMAKMEEVGHEEGVQTAMGAAMTAWIGLYRNMFAWSDLSSSTFRRWKTGEPNNNNNNEHCVSLDADLFMSDVDCGLQKSFICHEAPGPLSGVFHIRITRNQGAQCGNQISSCFGLRTFHLDREPFSADERRTDTRDHSDTTDHSETRHHSGTTDLRGTMGLSDVCGKDTDEDPDKGNLSEAAVTEQLFKLIQERLKEKVPKTTFRLQWSRAPTKEENRTEITSVSVIGPDFCVCDVHLRMSPQTQSDPLSLLQSPRPLSPLQSPRPLSTLQSPCPLSPSSPPPTVSASPLAHCLPISLPLATVSLQSPRPLSSAPVPSPTVSASSPLSLPLSPYAVSLAPCLVPSPPLPVPSPTVSAPVPSPTVSAPVPSPTVSAPVPSPTVSAPVPSPTVSAPVPSPIVFAPVPRPLVSAPSP